MTSAPSGVVESSVRERLLRLHWRNVPPSPPSVTACTQRSSPPSRFSTRITSAPMSARIALHHGRGDEAPVVEHPDPVEDGGRRVGGGHRDFGMPRMRSAIRLRWIWEVPAAIVYWNDQR